MTDMLTIISGELGVSVFLLLVLLTWSIIWKGIALWKAARAGQQGWFIAILIVNILGILEILYIAFFSKSSSQKKVRSRRKK